MFGAERRKRQRQVIADLLGEKVAEPLDAYTVASRAGARLASFVGDSVLPRVPVRVRLAVLGGLAPPVLALLLRRHGSVAVGALIGGFVVWGLVVARFVKREPKPDPADRQPNEIVATWPELTGPGTPLARALGGSTALLGARDRVGWAIEVTLAPGRTVEEVTAIAPNVESAFRIRRGALRVIAHDDAHKLTLRAVTRDQLRHEIRWPGPNTSTVLAPVALGVFEDGALCQLPLVPEPGRGMSLLIGGIPGSGKSGVLNVLVGAFAHCPDVCLWGIDPQGVELAAWAPVFDRLALDAGADAAQLIRDLERVMDARTRHMQAMGVRVWPPSPEHPELVLVADEFADLAPHMGRLSRIARAGRKAGVHLILATQRPSAKALGDWAGELRGMVGASICMRVSSTTDVNVVLGPGAASEGWRADRMLRDAGELLISSPDKEHTAPRRARSYRVTDDDVQKAAASAPRTPLDGASEAAMPRPEEAPDEAPEEEG